MKKNSFIVILIIIILGLGAYIVYDKFIAKDDTKKDDVTEVNNNKNTDTNSNTQSKNYVIEGYNNEKSWSGKEEDNKNVTITKHVILPKINIDNENAKKLNQKILDEYKDIINAIDNKNYYDTVSNRVTYDYYIFDNIIYVITNIIEIRYNSGGYNTYKGFYYDINNNVELSATDICKKYNITVSDINEAIKNLHVSDNDYNPNLENIKGLDEIIALEPLNNNQMYVYIQTTPAVQKLFITKK